MLCSESEVRFDDEEIVNEVLGWKQRSERRFKESDEEWCTFI